MQRKKRKEVSEQSNGDNGNCLKGGGTHDHGQKNTAS